MPELAAAAIVAINDAGDHIPGRPSRATVWRWVMHGIRGHRLESMLIGGRRYIAVDAIDRWLQAINGSNSFKSADTRKYRERSANAAHEALKSKGM